MSDSFVTPWTVAHQASLLMGFPRQEYWSGLPCPSPQDLPVPGIKPVSPDWQMDSLPLIQLGSPLYPTCVCVSARSFLTLCSPADCSLPGSSCWDCPGKNTEVGSHFLLQWVFPPQGLNSSLLCLQTGRHMFYHCAT